MSTLRQRYIEAWCRSYAAMVERGEITRFNARVNIDGFGGWTTKDIIARSQALGIEPVGEQLTFDTFPTPSSNPT
jgi:hypothetical protein